MTREEIDDLALDATAMIREQLRRSGVDCGDPGYCGPLFGTIRWYIERRTGAVYDGVQPVMLKVEPITPNQEEAWH